MRYLLALFLLVFASRAEAFSTGDMRRACLGTEPNQLLICATSITAIRDIAFYHDIAMRNGGVLKGACASSLPSPADLRAAFVNWSNMHPDLWGKPASASLMLAFANTWPCQ